MPRPHRRESESGIHHVMNRGVDHQTVFFADVDRVEFGQRLAAINERFEVTTLAYCLMDNHFHLLLQSPPEALSEAMHHLTSVYSRHTNDRLGRDGPLFRGRFHSIPVETDEYLLWVTRYIHRNPLDRPGVGSPADYRWSSYRAYLGRRPVAGFLDLAPVMALLGGDRSELVALTEDDRGDERPRRDLLSVGDVRRLVDCALAVDDLRHRPDSGRRPSLHRTLMVLLAARTDDRHLRRFLLDALSPPSDEAWRVAVSRAEQRLGHDPVIARALAWLERELAYGTCLAPTVRGPAGPRALVSR